MIMTNLLIERRAFVKCAVASTMAMTVSSTNGFTGEPGRKGTVPAEVSENPTLDLEQVTAATFEPAVGQNVKVSGSQAQFVLVAVNKHRDRNRAQRPAGVRQEPFSLLLSAPKGVHLSDGSYSLTITDLGKFDIFMNEVRQTSAFSSSSRLGQAEMFLNNVVDRTGLRVPRVFYQVIFN